MDEDEIRFKEEEKVRLEGSEEDLEGQKRDGEKEES